MDSDYSGSLQKTVNRAGFFRWGAENFKRFSQELFSIKLQQLKESLPAAEWKRLTDQKAVGIRPRLFFINGNPLFVANGGAKGLNAFSANCPGEGGLLEWRENMESFYCPFCQSTYDREGKSLKITDVSLIKHDTQVVDGQVMVKVNR